MVDSRVGRVLEDGHRSIFDEEEWDWIQGKARGDFDHLLIGTSIHTCWRLGLHYLEAWNEAVCDGAWGGLAASVGERMRRALDCDHWAAFQRSFVRLDLLKEVGSGERGRPPPRSASSPAMCTTPTLPRSRSGATTMSSAVYQAVCSPSGRRSTRTSGAGRLGHARPMEALFRGLARASGVDDPDIRWRFAGGPYFDNQIATLSLKGREASLTISRRQSAIRRQRAKAEAAFERRIA